MVSWAKMSKTKKLLTRSEYHELLRLGEFSECEFCTPGHRQIILHSAMNWLWIASLSPYWKYHTMFIPRRHITDVDELTTEEFTELKDLKQLALKRYKALDIKWPDGTTVNVFSYMWRVREGGVDQVSKVSKTMHLHLHMWPEDDGLMNSIADPYATEWNPDVLTTLPAIPAPIQTAMSESHPAAA